MTQIAPVLSDKNVIRTRPVTAHDRYVTSESEH